MGFDPVTMAATISKLKANGQIGYDGKTEKTYTFDGVVGDKPFTNGQVFISSDMPDINSIKSVTAILGGELITASKDELRLEIDKSMDGDTEVAYYGEYPVVAILKSDLSGIGIPAGIYVLFGGDMGYVTSVTFESGGIKPIDPKYLPGGGVTLPYIELHPEADSDGRLWVNESESAKLTELSKTPVPIIVVLQMMGNSAATIFTWNLDEKPSYIGSISLGGTTASMRLYSPTERWQFELTEQ